MICEYCEVDTGVADSHGNTEGCINALKSQLAALRAAAEPFVMTADALIAGTRDSMEVELMIGHTHGEYRKLAEAWKGRK